MKSWGAVGGAGEEDGAGLEAAGAALSPRMRTCWSLL